MYLYELLNLIGFTKLQQISLIKILFLTGCLSFVEPKGLNDLKDTIEINANFLNSEIKETLLFHQNDPQLSDQIAENILNKAKFDSKTQAFEWLHLITQKKLFRGKKERAQLEDKYKDNQELAKLLEIFHLTQELTVTGKFDSILILGCNEIGFRARTAFLAKQLASGNLHTSNIYVIGSDRPAFPYHEPLAEVILADEITSINKKTFNENFKLVEKIFLEVAIEYLKQFNINYGATLNDIRIIFKTNPSLYNIDELTLLLRNNKLFQNIPWPTETAISQKFTPEYLGKYNWQLINTPNQIIDNKIVRADTVGNAKIWLQTTGYQYDKPNLHHKVLIVSTQPHAQYQLNIFKSILGKNFEIKVIAPSSNMSNISLMLSELAALIATSKDLIFEQ